MYAFCASRASVDELFFARFTRYLIARGAAVSYRSDPRLVDMLRRARFVHARDPLPRCRRPPIITCCLETCRLR